MTGGALRHADLLAPAGRLTVPALFRCRLTHTRLEGVRRKFTYTVHLWLVDVDCLPRLPGMLDRLARFDPADHLGDPKRSLRENLDIYLGLNGIPLTGGRILMLAQPRGFGYAFDPVTFFFCYGADGNAVCVIAEVRNTFGERHCYLIRSETGLSNNVRKELYVSPFFPVDGHYRMRFALQPTQVSATVTLYRPRRAIGPKHARGELRHEPVLVAMLTGTRVRAPVSLGPSMLFPRRVLAAYRTIILTHWQASRLRRRGVTPARRRYHDGQPGVTAPTEANPVGHGSIEADRGIDA